MARRDPASEIEAAMTLLGDTPETVALRTGIDPERLQGHFETGGVLTPAEIAAFRRAYARLGVFMVALPGCAAVIQLTWVLELWAELRRHERWPEPWPEDTWRDRVTGRLWRWSLRRRGLGRRIGREHPTSTAFRAEVEEEANLVRAEALRAD